MKSVSIPLCESKFDEPKDIFYSFFLSLFPQKFSPNLNLSQPPMSHSFFTRDLKFYKTCEKSEKNTKQVRRIEKSPREERGLQLAIRLKHSLPNPQGRERSG